MNEEGIEKETLVSTTEEGLVVTGEKADALENRILTAVRKPAAVLLVLIVILYVIMAGLVLFLGNLEDTVDNTNRIVEEVAGPEARAAGAEQQAAIVKQLIDGFDCKDQINLQRFVDQLNEKGVSFLQGVDVVEDECMPKEG